ESRRPKADSAGRRDRPRTPVARRPTARDAPGVRRRSPGARADAPGGSCPCPAVLRRTPCAAPPARAGAPRAADRRPLPCVRYPNRSCAIDHSAAVSEPGEQATRRKRHAESFLEESVDEHEADEAQADAD